MSKVDPIILASETSDGKLKEITERLEQGVMELFDSERYKEYLKVMSKFHNYSFNNTMLIALQNPDASLVAGYNAWKNNFGRNVMKGEKGIRILAPSPYKVKQDVEKRDPQTGKVMTGSDGKPEMETKEITIPAYKVVSVFDVSQTEGRELPSVGVSELVADVEKYEDFYAALEKISPVPMKSEKIEGGAHGYYHSTEKRIAIDEGMSDLQNIKTAIHEIAHAMLHDIDIIRQEGNNFDRQTKEVQAESIAYTVCQHYGLDTSDYSFNYIAQWSSGRELPELKASLDMIRKTASELITGIDGQLRDREIQRDRELKQEQGKESLLLIQNSDLSEYSLLYVRGMDAAEIVEALSAMNDDDRMNVAVYLESKGAWTTEIANEETREFGEYHLDVRYYTDTQKIINLKAEMELNETAKEPIGTDDVKEPTVTIVWSENSQLREGETMPLSRANILFKILDEANITSPGYNKTKFRIDFVMNGRSNHYEGRQDLGDGEGTLIEHIEKYNVYYANNPDWDKYLLTHKGKEALEDDKLQRDMVLNEFVPYLKMHCNLSEMERISREALQSREKLTSTEVAYHTAIQAYVDECREIINHGEYNLPPVPQLRDFDMELQDYKKHVEEEIAQEAAAAGMTVEEYAANGYEPYINTTHIPVADNPRREMTRERKSVLKDLHTKQNQINTGDKKQNQKADRGMER